MGYGETSEDNTSAAKKPPSQVHTSQVVGPSKDKDYYQSLSKDKLIDELDCLAEDIYENIKGDETLLHQWSMLTRDEPR